MKTYDLIIIGGGLSGMHAASYASYSGLKVLLLESAPFLGGTVSLLTHQFSMLNHKRGFELVADAKEALLDAGVDVRLNTAVAGIYKDLVITTVSNEKYEKFQGKAILVTTGSYQKYVSFKNNDLPGIYGIKTVLELIHRHGVIPGKKVIIIGHAYAETLKSYFKDAGIRVVAHVDKTDVISAAGKEAFKKLIAEDRTYSADFVVIAEGFLPAYQLFSMVDAKLVYDQNQDSWIPALKNHMTTLPGLFAAGNVTGVKPLHQNIEEAKLSVDDIISYLGGQHG